MAKCGKGCMPECEYFTTGGCISPFNCMYKEENGYINNATSGTVIYKKGMNMSDEEIERCLERFVMGKTCDVINFDYAGTLAYIQRLKAENAALREQISKMIMPPCTLGDTLHVISFYFGDGYDETGKAVHQIGWQITETKVDEKNFYRMCDLVRNKKAFFSREAAEARLAELKGE